MNKHNLAPDIKTLKVRSHQQNFQSISQQNVSYIKHSSHRSHFPAKKLSVGQKSWIIFHPLAKFSFSWISIEILPVKIRTMVNVTFESYFQCVFIGYMINSCCTMNIGFVLEFVGLNLQITNKLSEMRDVIIWLCN